MGAYSAQDVFPSPASARSRGGSARSRRTEPAVADAGSPGRASPDACSPAPRPHRHRCTRVCRCAGFVLSIFTTDASNAAGTLILLVAVASVMTCWAVIDGPMTKVTSTAW